MYGVVNAVVIAVCSDVIHGALYAQRPDVNALLHTHIPDVVSVCCLPGGLQYFSQGGISCACD